MVIRTRACFLSGGKLRQLFFPHFSSILLSAAEPTQVDGNRRGRSRYAGVASRPTGSRGGPSEGSSAELTAEGLPAQSRCRSNSDTDVIWRPAW